MTKKRDHSPEETPAPTVPATASTQQEAAPASASTAPAVPLAGVPETPAPNVGIASTGPAVPSTDHADDAALKVEDTEDPEREIRDPYPHRD